MGRRGPAKYSAFALPQLITEQRKYDLICVDGSHLFDDSTDSQVAKVLRFIESNYDEIYRAEALLKGNIKERLKRRLARRLHKNQLTAYRKLRDGRQNWGQPLKEF